MFNGLYIDTLHSVKHHYFKLFSSTAVTLTDGYAMFAFFSNGLTLSVFKYRWL